MTTAPTIADWSWLKRTRFYQRIRPDREIVMHHMHEARGPGGRYIAELGWPASRISRKHWTVSLYRVIETRSWWCWLPFIHPRISYEVVSRNDQLRRLIFGRRAYDELVAEADRLALGEVADAGSARAAG
jgi:hypothetical protein